MDLNPNSTGDDRYALAGAAAPSGLPRRDDERLDAVLAFVLAFGVLGGVAWYASQGAVGDAHLWPAARSTEAAAAAPTAIPVHPADVAAAPVMRTLPEDSTVSPVLPMMPAASAPSLPAPVVEAPVAAVAVAPVAPPAPVVEAPSAPAVAASLPAVVAEPASTPAVVPPPVTAAEPRVLIREHVRFAMNAYAVPASAKARLDEIARQLANDPRTLTIAGHTDNTGKRGTNNVLSQKRAEAVRAYLVAQGVPAERLKAVGRGSSQPIADNASEAGRAKNRRIDITE